MSVALVTGAGQGLGRAICVRLAEAGYRIVAVDKNETAATATAEETGGLALGCDVSDRSAVLALADRVGEIDVLVNNAGVWFPAPLLDAAEKDVMSVVTTNLLGPLWCCQAFAPKMRRGSIVNISSAAAKTHTPGVSMYVAAKKGLEGLTVQLAVELGLRHPGQCRGSGSYPDRRCEIPCW